MGCQDETWDALIALKQQGLVRAIGVSNYAKADLEALETNGGAKPVVNQCSMSLQGWDKETLEVCKLILSPKKKRCQCNSFSYIVLPQNIPVVEINVFVV